MPVDLLPLVVSSGWASGVNAYLVVLVLGFADRAWGLAQVPDVLARTDVLVVAGLFFAVEFVADKIPYVDSSWDAVSTAIRPTVRAIHGWVTASSTTPATDRSSARLVPALVTGSGEVLIASRSPAFTPCDARAVPPPRTA